MAANFLRSIRFFGVLLFTANLVGVVFAEEGELLERIRLPDPKLGDSFGVSKTDVVIAKRGGLVHTAQIFSPKSADGEIGFDGFLSELRSLCQAHGEELDAVAKLNLYVASDDGETVEEVRSSIEKAWPEGTAPAVTLVQSPLPGGSALAGDAVFVKRNSGEGVIDFSVANTAVVPAGRDIIHVSGRAASGELAEATAGTMVQLFEVLAHLGSEPKDVVQVKAFLQPMSGWETVKEEIEKSFGSVETPPLVFVEWSSTSRATEIELIAAAPDAVETGETVSYFTPPGDKASPVFSRVGRIHADRVIYTSGLYAAIEDEPLPEVKRVFARLNEWGRAAGTDLRHLAKATYYVSDSDLSATLNEVRPEVYDPERPPAASKVAVPSVGGAEVGLLMDFIAVPTAKGQ